MSSDLTFQSATALAGLIRSKQASPVEVLEAHIQRIEQVNPKLNAFVTTTFDRARQQAREAEQRIASGGRLGLLEGVPVSIKDSIETAGIRTVAGTRLRESFVPAVDAPVVARLKRAGAILLGKTNVPECCLDFRAENPVFGRTSNPWALDRVPGGSSGGEAAAISSGCSAAGMGSDLGGSIRVPAHFCGIVGLKPTPGRIPGSGHFPPSAGVFWLAAVIGPLARRVEDLVLLLKVLGGYEPSDPMSVPLPARNLKKINPRRAKVMWYADDGIAPVTAATRQTIERAASALAEHGFAMAQRRPQGLERAYDLWYTWLCESGVPDVIAMYKGKDELMGPLIRDMKSRVRPLSLGEFFAAWYARDELRASVLNEMAEHPIILAPAAALPAFRHEHRGPFDVDGQQVDYLKAFSYTETYNLLGLPVVVVPCGKSPEGLPIGVQVVGRPFEEETVLAVAALLEESLGGYQRPPL